MELEQLKEYLSIVVDMEKSIFLQNSLISSLYNEIDELKKPKIISDPAMTYRSEPIRQPVKFEEKPPEQPVELKPVPSVLKCVFAGIGLFYATVALGFMIRFVPLIILGAIISPFIPFIYRSHIKSDQEAEQARMVRAEDARKRWNAEQKQLAEKKADEEYEKQLAKYREEYNRELEKYQRIIEDNKLMRQQDEDERKSKMLYLQAEIDETKNKLAVSTERLDAMYAKNIIFPKYQNLAMVCSIYEYICAGRCTALEGSDGAYNILEMEIRLDRVVVQLDNVINQLGQIRQNQFMLYTAIRESNQLSEKILDASNNLSEQFSSFACDLSSRITESSKQISNSLNSFHGDAAQLSSQIAELQKASELTAYCAERSQRELVYMNRMDYLSGRNDDVFWNTPPV